MNDPVRVHALERRRELVDVVRSSSIVSRSPRGGAAGALAFERLQGERREAVVRLTRGVDGDEVRTRRASLRAVS